MKKCPRCGVTYKDNIKHCQDDGAPLEAIEELQPGTILNKKYRIVEELGHGGMGVVYRAQHILFKEDRALKLIGARSSDDPHAVRRFLAEALMARQIDHRNVVRVFDAEETEDGQPYVVMEYVEGDGLRRVLRQGAGSEQSPLDPLRAIAIAVQVCAALAAAHQKRIIHRDVKPDNILVGRNPDGSDLVKVVDFGIAKAKKELQGPWSGTLSLSQTGAFLGTPQYSSPEQAAGTKGDLLDHRTDIYSLGIVLYEMLVGRPPFTGDVEEVLRQQKEAAPKDLRNLNPAIPEDLAAVAMKALSKSPAARFASADEMRMALERARDAMLRPPVPVPKEEPLAPTKPREPKPPRLTPIP